MMTDHEFYSATQALIAERPDLEDMRVHESMLPALGVLQEHNSLLTSHLEPERVSLCATLGDSPVAFIRIVWKADVEVELRVFSDRQLELFSGRTQIGSNIEDVENTLRLLCTLAEGVA